MGFMKHALRAKCVLDDLPLLVWMKHVSCTNSSFCSGPLCSSPALETQECCSVIDFLFLTFLD